MGPTCTDPAARVNHAIQQPIDEMAKRAVELLQKRIVGEQATGSVQLPLSLIDGEQLDKWKLRQAVR